MAILAMLLPIVAELLKIFFGGSSASEKEKIAEQIRGELAKIRGAIKKSVDTEGDTSDLEDIINKRG